jgi:hypothetical protein
MSYLEETREHAYAVLQGLEPDEDGLYPVSPDEADVLCDYLLARLNCPVCDGIGCEFCPALLISSEGSYAA